MMECPPFGSALQLSLVLTSGDQTSIQASVDDFVSEELVKLLPASARLISIDGLDGVGKSTLARAVAERTAVMLIKLDDYLEQHQDRYLAALDIDALKREIATNERSVVEGCLVMDVLSKAGLTPDFSVYVARTSRMRAQPEMEWLDEHDLLVGAKTASEIIGELESQAQRWAQAPPEFGGGDVAALDGLTKELITYHERFAPQRHADLIVKLVRPS